VHLQPGGLRGGAPSLRSIHHASGKPEASEPLEVRFPIGVYAMKAALVTPILSQLPFHPSCYLGYGAAVLQSRYDVDVIDLNAEMHFKQRGQLEQVLHRINEARIVTDDLFLYPFYDQQESRTDRAYSAVAWREYSAVYVTAPSWFPTVSTEAVLRLAGAVQRASPRTRVFFFGNSLGSWTSEGDLRNHGVQPVHLNDLFDVDPSAGPVWYDLLPAPIYENRDKYLFDLLPFTLKHGCSWGRCRFCSLSRGWNSGYLERSAKAAIKELEVLIDRYDPKVLVCRDHSLNGHNLIEFCGYLESFNKPWCGQSRADLSRREIQALRKAGCRGIFFGLESGSDRTLREMNKGITSKQMSDFIKRLHSNGILPAPSLIIGAPGEGRTDFEKTIQFLVDHRRYFDVVNVYPFMATPASESTSQKGQPDKNTLLRLFRFIRTCEDLGLNVIVGEQCIEYFLFNKICTDQLAVS
jgi:hypothetical protein